MSTSFRMISVTFALVGLYCLVVSFGPALVFGQSVPVETEVAQAAR